MTISPPREHHSDPLLALISTILDFPSPTQATRSDYDRLHHALSRQCPLGQFAIYSSGETGWIYENGLSPTFKAGFESNRTLMITHRAPLEETGWCLLPVATQPPLWLLAKTKPEDQTLLHLLLECLANHLSCTATAVPEQGKAAWQHKVTYLDQLTRQIDLLSLEELYRELDRVAHLMLGAEAFLLARLEEETLIPLYPARANLTRLAGLCQSDRPTETQAQDLYWHCQPLHLQRHYFAHLLLGTRRPPQGEERLLIHFFQEQLRLLLELSAMQEPQLPGACPGPSTSQRLRQLHRNNVSLQRQLRRHQALERKLQFDALHDPLTGLPNRASLMSRVEQAVKHFQRHQSPDFALCFIDLDHFKEVNDNLGHHAGDLLLKEIAGRLQGALRQNDLVARLGGDEFVIYLDAGELASGIPQAIDRMLNALHAPYRIAGNALSVSLSMGVAMMTPRITDAGQLLRQADLAMYQAKRNGRNQVVTYPGGNGEWRGGPPEEALREALARGDVQPYFQPVIRLEGCHLCGFEVMARWLTPKGEIWDAQDFIPLAEQSGLVIELDRHILRCACQALHGWLTQPDACTLQLGINLSGKHLASREQMSALLAIIRDCGVSPHHLAFEFSERELSRQDAGALALLHELRGHGVHVCLDNFGVGFSSLSSLLHYPVDYLKVDSSFTHRMLLSSKDLAMIRILHDISQGLGFVLVIEGIESAPEYQKLIEMGCELGQGRFISPPLPGGEIPPLLEQPLAIAD